MNLWKERRPYTTQYSFHLRAEPFCSPRTLAALSWDLIRRPTGSNSAAPLGRTLRSGELRFFSHHNNSLSVCWSGAPNFVALTAAGPAPDFLQRCPASSPSEGTIAFTAEFDGRGDPYLASAPRPQHAFCPHRNFISAVLLCIGTICFCFGFCISLLASGQYISTGFL